MEEGKSTVGISISETSSENIDDHMCSSVYISHSTWDTLPLTRNFLGDSLHLLTLPIIHCILLYRYNCKV